MLASFSKFDQGYWEKIDFGNEHGFLNLLFELIFDHGKSTCKIYKFEKLENVDIYFQLKKRLFE